MTCKLWLLTKACSLVGEVPFVFSLTYGPQISGTKRFLGLNNRREPTLKMFLKISPLDGGVDKLIQSVIRLMEKDSRADSLCDHEQVLNLQRRNLIIQTQRPFECKMMKFMDCEWIHQSKWWLKPKSECRTSYFIGPTSTSQVLGCLKNVFLCRECIIHLSNLKNLRMYSMNILGYTREFIQLYWNFLLSPTENESKPVPVLILISVDDRGHERTPQTFYARKVSSCLYSDGTVGRNAGTVGFLVLCRTSGCLKA